MLEPLVLIVALVVAGIAAGIAVIYLNRRASGASLETCQALATEQFKEWLNSRGAEQLGLSPDHCEVVDESQTFTRDRSGLVHLYTLTRFLRNRQGRYFMFKSTPRGPYVKSVPSSVARVVLKSKYVQVPDA